VTEKQKLAHFVKLANLYRKRFTIDNKFDISVVKGEDDSKGVDDDMPHWLALEEQVVTSLTKSLIGPQRYKRYETIMDNLKGKGTLAWMDDEMANYWRLKIVVYPLLLTLDGDDFKLFAEVICCHELLHIVLLPLSSYTKHLEGK